MTKLLGPVSPPPSSRALGGVLFGLCLGPSATLYAQATPALSSAPSTTYSAQLGLYLVALLVGLSGLGWYALVRARQQPSLSLEPDDDDLEVPPTRQLSPPPLPATSSSSSSSARHSLESGRFHVDALQVPTESSILKPLFTTGGEGQQKLCPACKKTYASWMVICPVDASALVTNPVAAHERRKQARQAPNARSTLTRMRCGACQRRVAQGASFCPYDGSALLVDTIEAALVAPEHKICRHCGVDPTQRAKPCRSSACDIKALNPTMIQAQLGGIAMTLCPRCHAVGAPGQLHCEHDQELLVPMTSVELGALPHAGYGERRKICGQCATRFGGDYQHCTYDGTPLTPLN